MMSRFLLWLLLFQCAFKYGAAQQYLADTTTKQIALQNVLQLYQRNAGGYNALYNGIEYTGSYPGTTGHPYFQQDTLQQGSITYDGVFYPAIGLNYNLVSNEVIIMGKQNLAISLIPEKIASFTILEHQFIHVKEDSSTATAGYYEVLYNGPVTLLAKRSKKIERSSRVEDPMVFKQYNRYFIKKNDILYPVDSEKELLVICSDKKEALKLYLRKSKLRFKKDLENSLLKAVSYYDQLKN